MAIISIITPYYFIIGAIASAYTIYNLWVVERNEGSTFNNILVPVVVFFTWLPGIIWVEINKRRKKNKA